MDFTLCTLAPDSSRIVVGTRAEGLLSRLAHDLEIEIRPKQGARDGPSSAKIEISEADVHVVGAVKKGRVDKAVLSASDIADIEKRIRDDVFRGRVLTVRGVKTADNIQLSASFAGGPSAAIVCKEHVVEADKATGTATLSLRALGVADQKGPLGAFKVSDAVSLSFELRFVSA